jgi:hypothetical protein
VCEGRALAQRGSLVHLGGGEGQESSGSVHREQRWSECRTLGWSKALKSGSLERAIKGARQDAAELLDIGRERAFGTGASSR